MDCETEVNVFHMCICKFYESYPAILQLQSLDLLFMIAMCKEKSKNIKTWRAYCAMFGGFWWSRYVYYIIGRFFGRVLYLTLLLKKMFVILSHPN